MGIYDYRCEDCSYEFVSEEHLDLGLTKCSECGKIGIRRVFNSPNVIFKGKGFYQNDGKNRLTG